MPSLIVLSNPLFHCLTLTLSMANPVILCSGSLSKIWIYLIISLFLYLSLSMPPSLFFSLLQSYSFLQFSFSSLPPSPSMFIINYHLFLFQHFSLCKATCMTKKTATFVEKLLRICWELFVEEILLRKHVEKMLRNCWENVEKCWENLLRKCWEMLRKPVEKLLRKFGWETLLRK